MIKLAQAGEMADDLQLSYFGQIKVVTQQVCRQGRFWYINIRQECACAPR
jgi:hypothetical protein